MVIAKIKIVSNALYSYPAADLTCHWMIGDRFSRELLRLVINILLENCTMMSSTLCFWTAQFLILDCTNCILDCTNWFDCTLRISPAQVTSPNSVPTGYSSQPCNLRPYCLTDFSESVVNVCLHYFMVWKRVLCENTISVH